MTAALDSWWVHVIGVRRLVGSGAGGDVYSPAAPAAPAPLTGFWHDGTKLVRDANGEEIVSSAQFAYPLSGGAVPAGSQVIAPAAFGGATRIVIACARGDGGGQPTPDHYELQLR